MSDPTKSELLAALRATGDDLVAKVGAMPAAAFEDGRYENGWNARQILAHVASIEWTYKRLIDGARGEGAGSQPPSAVASGSRPPARQPDPTRPAPGSPIDDYNARQVERRAGATVTELLDEFATNRAATIAAVEAASDALLATPVRSAGGAQGTLAAVIDFVAVQHVRGHVRDIAGESA